MRGEVVRRRRPADEGLNQVRRVPTYGEGAASDGGEVGEGPGGLLRGFEEDGGAGEEGGYYGAHKIVKLELSISSCVKSGWRGCTTG